MTRPRDSQKSMNTLFPLPQAAVLACRGCGHEHRFSSAWRVRELVRRWDEGCAECESADLRLPHTVDRGCRVCHEPIDDGRRNYCSDWCKELAQAVQRHFIWREVRERVLERDDHTCQECGFSKVMWLRAYWQVRERVDERNPHDSAENHAAWRKRDKELREAYNDVGPPDGGYHVDHILRAADGGHLFDVRNLRTLCQWCHREKTAAENRGRPPGNEHRPELPLANFDQPES